MGAFSTWGRANILFLSFSANSASLRLIKAAFKTAESAEDAEIPASKLQKSSSPPTKRYARSICCGKLLPTEGGYSIFEDGFVNETRIVPIFLQIGRDRHDKIEWNASLSDFPVQELGRVSAVSAFRHHHQKVDITFSVRFTPRCGTEENDTQRPHEPDDIPGKLLYGGNAGFHLSFPRYPNPENPEPKRSTGYHFSKFSNFLIVACRFSRIKIQAPTRRQANGLRQGDVLLDGDE